MNDLDIINKTTITVDRDIVDLNNLSSLELNKLLMEITLLSEELINIDDIKLIIKYGADINYQADDDWSPLMNVLLDPINSLEIIEMLIESGADVNIKLKNKKTILMHCIENSFKKDDLQIIKLILRKGAQINSKNINGNSALMLCFYNYQNFSIRYDIIKILLENKADIYIKNNTGQNVFDLLKRKLGYLTDFYSLIFNYKNIKNDHFCECDINFIYEYRYKN